MARTAAGQELSQRHRLRQLAVRAQVTREFMQIWPLWDPADPDTFDRLVEVTVPLVVARREVSAGIASDYFRAFRMVEGVGGTAAPQVSGTVPRDKIVTSLYVTGLSQSRRSVAAGFSPQAARQNSLTTLAGAVARHTLDGGRETLLRSAESDPRARGYQRVTDASPCAFCAMLAARGPVFSESTGGFKAHDHCGCTAEPAYEGTELPETSQRLRGLWSEAQKVGDASGTSNDQLNNFRRLLESNA